MSGKKGMKRASKANVIRRKIWSSMRILRRFTIPDLVRTVPGATVNNVGKYVHMLQRHGYVTKNGASPTGRLGEFQTFHLIRNPGPVHPNACDCCGQALTVKVCIDPKKEKETKEETEKETNKEAPNEVNHDQT